MMITVSDLVGEELGQLRVNFRQLCEATVTRACENSVNSWDNYDHYTWQRICVANINLSTLLKDNV